MRARKHFGGARELRSCYDGTKGDKSSSDSSAIAIVAFELCSMHDVRFRDVGNVDTEITRFAVTAANVDTIICGNGGHIRGYGGRGVGDIGLRVEQCTCVQGAQYNDVVDSRGRGGDTLLL